MYGLYKTGRPDFLYYDVHFENAMGVLGPAAAESPSPLLQQLHPQK